MNNHWEDKIKEDEVRKFFQLVVPQNTMEVIDVFFKIEYLETAISKIKD